METGFVANVKKIAVLRAMVLGDLIFVLPAFEALHAAYPQAEITYLGRPWAAEFAAKRIPGVTQFETFHSSPVDFEDIGFLIHPEEAASFFPRMQAEKFDLAISLQGGGKNSNPFLRRLHPRVAVGSREEGAIAPDRWLPHDYYQHDVIRNLDLVGLVGAVPIGWTPRLPVLPFDLEAAAPFLQNICRPFVVVHSGARDIRRCWPEEQFARLADTLKCQYHMEVVLTGTAVDAERAVLVEQAMKETPVNLSGQLSLPALTGLLANADLIISNDTGVLHLGLAVGCRAVGLFWGEYASKSMPLSRGRFQPVIAWERRCPICGMFLDQHEVVESGPRPCMHQVSFLSEITQVQVLHAVDQVLTAP